MYVHTGAGFDLAAWLRGLKAGRSFVTTGPMLFATVNRCLPGEPFEFAATPGDGVALEVESVSEKPVGRIEVLVNGRIVETIIPELMRTEAGAWRATVRRTVPIRGTSWLAVRSVEPQPDGRQRFAHTAPWYFAVGGQPMMPRREQVECFVGLMEEELRRNRTVLAPVALAEFEQACEFYRGLLSRAR